MCVQIAFTINFLNLNYLQAAKQLRKLESNQRKVLSAVNPQHVFQFWIIFVKGSRYHCRYKENFEIARTADTGNCPESRTVELNWIKVF